MSRKRLAILACLACVLLAGACAVSPGATSPTPPAQPEPIATGVPAPTLEAAYRAGQADPALDDEARVCAAVDTYFTLKYESRLAGQALDLGVVIDRSTPAGEALHDYELGRLQYSLFCWQDTGSTVVAYSYHPTHESVEIDGDTALVRVLPRIDLRHAGSNTAETLADGGLHAMRLVRRPAGWRLMQDDYRDEMKDLFPVGTDWAALQASYPERKRQWETRQAELEWQMGPRPTDAMPTDLTDAEKR